MASKTVYVKKPGGVIAPLANGDTKHFAYGDAVDLNALSDTGRKHVSRVTTTKKLKEDAPAPTDNSLQAAMADATNVNTTASAVPGNYRDLSEDDAIRLIQMVRDPKAQAEIVAFEMANEGRSKVINAASEDVRDEAEVRRLVEDHAAEQLAETPQPEGFPPVTDPDKQPPPEQPPVFGPSGSSTAVPPPTS